jgi:hypothetical protein
MITPSELFDKSDRLFFNIVRAALKGESSFPLAISSDKRINETGFNKLHDAIVPIYTNSKEVKGKGYSVEWKIKNIEGTKQKLPGKIYFETFEDYLFFTKREKDHLKIEEACKLIAHSFPSNWAWAKDHPSFLLTYADIMPDLLKVVRYFFDHTPPYDLYLRELPIQVHSKFIEDNIKPLKKMLDIILSEDKIDFDEKDFSGRYKIKSPNIYTQIRVLDDALKPTLGFKELALTLDDSSLLNWKPDKVFIIENKACFLSFPKVKNGVAIFGEGFKSRVSKHISWLAESQLYCWFDMDPAGFEMLNMVRQFYNHAKSFLMDEKTYNEFSKFSVDSVYRSIALTLLTSEEEKMYHFLQQTNKRLEQERISNVYVQDHLKNII